MFIKRICVEEGFLHRLDLELGEGLTVLIGARGCGKTSIIELIRFALDAPSYSATSGEAARKQAVAVLGTGKVTLTLDVDGQEVTLTRSADEPAPRRSSDLPLLMPIVLSQSEIEQVGLRPDSRKRLLDGFVPSLRDNERAEDASRALISSLTVELRGVQAEIFSAADELSRLNALASELPAAREAAKNAHANLDQTETERARVEQLDRLTAAGAVRVTLYDRAEGVAAGRLKQIRSVLPSFPIEPWPDAAATEDRLGSLRTLLDEADALLVAAEAKVEAAASAARSLSASEQSSQLALEDEARLIRSHLDELSEGAGLLMKRVSDLEAANQRALALEERRKSLVGRATEVAQRREAELDRLDALREQRVNAREEAAAYLNRRLGPRIRVTVNRFGSVDEYAAAIAEGLRGSGLQYNPLAFELSRIISPRELALAAEADDAAAIARITGIAADRAQRVATHLREVGTEGILTAALGDTVHLALLDGGAYKPAEDLSVGQRCTAVLPIILSHTERVLIVDQPEDNLDNSFIAETLVKVLQNRPDRSQLLFATHNPNVPVLGEADRVVFMTSDGKRGDIQHVGELDAVESVRAISDVMEGGRQAFETRAAFYASEYGSSEQD